MRVLIVDDSSTVRRTLALHLQGRVTRVETVASGHQALHSIKNDRWDWIIADAHMADTADDQAKWLCDLRDATDAEIIINSVNDSPEIQQLCRDRSMHRVLKGDYEQITRMMGMAAPAAREDRGMTPDAVFAMIRESELRVSKERDARIEEIFRGMGLWDNLTSKPNLGWVRERKDAYDKTQSRMEKLGIGLASAVVIAGAMLAFQLIWAGISQKVGKP